MQHTLLTIAEQLEKWAKEEMDGEKFHASRLEGLAMQLKLQAENEISIKLTSVQFKSLVSLADAEHQKTGKAFFLGLKHSLEQQFKRDRLEFEQSTTQQ